MTPFGVKIRDWRHRKNRTLHQQAEALGVTAAYLSALETGTRGRPSAVLVDQICVWLGLIWDDAEELKRLAGLSHPKPTINARSSSAEAVYLANFLAQNIDRLSSADCQLVIDLMTKRLRLNDHAISHSTDHSAPKNGDADLP
ncbi:helix-turn-helix domain-containing protein [Alphaproteobacteria bacterium]|nr:helix-turn-helix domain-containing protein [Alphaproteobacteria bacterium]